MGLTLEQPFEQRTTLSIDIANRLYSLRGQPGFNDLVRLSLEVVKIAEDAFVNYEGWDKDELAARSIAFRAARKFHDMLWAKVDATIVNGIEEVRQEQEAARDEGRDAVAMADSLRAAVLRTHDELYDSRIPGTY